MNALEYYGLEMQSLYALRCTLSAVLIKLRGYSSARGAFDMLLLIAANLNKKNNHQPA